MFSRGSRTTGAAITQYMALASKVQNAVMRWPLELAGVPASRFVTLHTP